MWLCVSCERKKAVKALIKQRGKGHDDYTFNRIQRWFYTFKALVCMALNRQKSMWSDIEAVSGIAHWNEGYTSNPEYSGHDWTELSVGYGILKNWHYDIYDNSSY